MARATPPAAVEMIRRFEGLHRVLRESGLIAAYLCPANVWTQGWGSTRDIHGQAITAASPPVTRETADAMCARDLRMVEAAVARLVRIPVTDNQFGALVSFVHNLGPGRLQASTLLRRLNAGLFDQAADEFPKWVMGGGRRLPGLVLRREAERAMFLTPDPEPPAPPVVVPAKARDAEWLRRFMDAFRAAGAPAG